jgi:hypothetical protein
MGYIQLVNPLSLNKDNSQMIKSKLAATALVALMALGSVTTPSEARSKRYCRAYAEDVANRKAGAQQIVGGAVGGAVAGGVIGAIVGGRHSVRDGAIIGGIGGTVLGGVHANKKWKKHYNRAYANCRAS